MSASEENTYLLDPESPAELARLINLDRMTTQAMGGPLSGLTQEEVGALRNVLDLGCGPGGWVLDVAFSCPDAEVAGVDISRSMIDYANARAYSQGLTNASFGVMNLAQPLDFPDSSFDLINARFLITALRREMWPPLLVECLRLLRPGGIIRLTESVNIGSTSSAAFERLYVIVAQAFRRLGYGFSPAGYNYDMTYIMPHLLRTAGFRDVRYQAHALEFSAGTDAWADFYHAQEVTHNTARPGLVPPDLASPEEIEQLFQQLLVEMKAPDFCGMWHYVTVLGNKPLEDA
ncbi:MAG TPA: class I SAM-dependent methyltransferase [Ktedonobacteraceae bacterium]|jgi:ubiquinone/menaquinone biosynthesis C-methylase UbiE|nr:class I SAM-dependent methyltransferase [Ktedonobacteraceae bacterium]